MKQSWFKRISQSRLFIGLSHWEYWPFAAVYFPIYPVWLWYAFKSRSIFFFGPSNPGIRYAGFLMESKKEIYDTYSALNMPVTILMCPLSHLEDIEQILQQEKLSYPLIAKPDIGMQGRGVYKIESREQLKSLITQIQVSYVLQPFIPLAKEIGVFFVRTAAFPNGHITGVVEKVFVEVTGDGCSSIRQLLAKSRRYRFHLPSLLKSIGSKIDEIPTKGVTEVLVPFGNHARGAMFLDATKQMAALLTPVIQQHMKLAPGFNYGRLDIRYSSESEMAANTNWTIIEINGAGSEPTHMYDPAHKLWHAWKEIIHHWHLLYLVSKENRQAGFKNMSLKEGISMYSAFIKYKAQLSEHNSLDINQLNISKTESYLKQTDQGFPRPDALMMIEN